MCPTQGSWAGVRVWGIINASTLIHKEGNHGGGGSITSELAVCLQIGVYTELAELSNYRTNGVT